MVRAILFLFGGVVRAVNFMPRLVFFTSLLSDEILISLLPKQKTHSQCQLVYIAMIGIVSRLIGNTL